MDITHFHACNASLCGKKKKKKNPSMHVLTGYIGCLKNFQCPCPLGFTNDLKKKNALPAWFD
jgi:hypothetical protein